MPSVAVECSGHAIESLLVDEARVGVGEGDGKLNLRRVGALERSWVGYMAGEEYART